MALVNTCSDVGQPRFVVVKDDGGRAGGWVTVLAESRHGGRGPAGDPTPGPSRPRYG